ncbi:hypothetical protein LP52_16185 [Streptomonospora alba]|uniref:Uncharacterized protein n=1 Tax=Streptomonospora alba TaxID=183763 RepID=A0A0C2FF93_9ACTN|nr:hypothetical protein LP52_16185 [Streptomonospora alba]
MRAMSSESSSRRPATRPALSASRAARRRSAETTLRAIPNSQASSFPFSGRKASAERIAAKKTSAVRSAAVCRSSTRRATNLVILSTCRR